MSRMLTRFFKFLSDLLHDPMKVVGLCITMFLLNTVFDGSAFSLWKLYRDSHQVRQKIAYLEAENRQLDQKIKKAADPQFIENQARERFNMVSEGDLIFIFSDD